MNDLLERADPARDAHIDPVVLRAKIEERIGVSAPLRAPSPPIRRPWVIAIAGFAAVLAFALPVLLRDQPRSVFAPNVDGIADHPGVVTAVPLASGGRQAMDVDGDTIWVMTTLQNLLQRVSAVSGEVTATYTIESRVEGLVVGGGRIWLLTPDDGGEVLRFDPAAGIVDRSIPIGGSPGWARWLGGSLWVGNDQGEVLQVTPEGVIASTLPGELVGGEGLGRLWVNDPETDLISSLSGSGEVGELVIPTLRGLDTMSGSGIRQVAEADGRLFLLDGDYPWGTNLNVFDPSSGEFGAFGGLTFGLLDLIEHDGYLWVTSSTDHLLIRIDPTTGEQHRYPMPGKPGGMIVAEGALWVTLYQPGALVRVDATEMIEAGPVVADDWNRFPHRLLCTGEVGTGTPTVLLQPSDWIDYGSMSVIQAQLSEQGYLACANGYVQGEASAEQQAADLEEALSQAGIPGPYLLVAAVDGVHAARLFADGRDDIAGVVLVDPMPVGFPSFYDDLLPDSFGHPPWLDLEPGLAATLGDFGDLPMVVIEQDPEAVFLSTGFAEAAGQEEAEAIDGYWRAGSSSYAGLSSNARSVVATGTGLDGVVMNRPELVVGEVLDLLSQIGDGG